MATITKREFHVLDLSRDRYLEWKVDALTYLTANGLDKTIEEGQDITPQEKARAIVFLRHHIHDSLKYEYLMVDDPKELWDNLAERYGNQKNIILPTTFE